MACNTPRRRFDRCLSTLLQSSKHRQSSTLVQSRSPFQSNRLSTNTKSTCFPTRSIKSPNLLARNQSATTNHQQQILSAALNHVHSEGWTDEAVASGTLDAGYPPSYIGRVTNSTSLFGSGELVSFFMDQCNHEFKMELEKLQKEESENKQDEDIATRLNRALKCRLVAVTPFVTSRRWHEGMAIGALPQNAQRTASQLDEMSQIVLDYVFYDSQMMVGPAHRAAVVAVYAAAELHLVSEGMNESRGVSGSSISYSGDRYVSTWDFLQQRCEEAARLLNNDNASGILPSMLESTSGVSLNPTHVAAASAVASSLVGAAFSLAAPVSAAVAGSALPRVVDALRPLQDYVVSKSVTTDGTKPSDYQVEDLPPFDTSEVIFPENETKTA